MPRTLRLAVLAAAAAVCFAGHHYTVEATLDPVRNQIRGTTRFSYRNPLSGPLGDIPVHTFAEISRVADSAGRELRFQRNYLLAGDAIVLPQPLPPGGSIELDIAFTVGFAEHRDGYRLLTGAWHPKALVFREGRFLRQEKQADSYEVTLTAPAAEVVVTSGKLVAEETLPDGMKRRRYRVDDITNFGIASSPKFLQASRQAGEVAIRSHYLPGGEKWGVKLAEYAERIVGFYRKTFGFYPQEVVSILPGSKTSGGGYPAASNLFVVHDTLDRQGGEPFAEWIMAHEIGHQYWGYDTVIDSGVYYHWPGLALGIYTDRLYSEAHIPGRTHRSFISGYLGGVEAGYDTTIRRTWAEIEKLPFDFNNTVAHGKAYAVIQMLEELIGKQTFFKLVTSILERYRSRYLSFEDFERVAEEVSGQKLDWFFRDWVDGNKVLSYAIEGVELTAGEARIKVRRTGTAGMPLVLEVMLEDGQRLRQRIAREPEVQTLVFRARGNVKQARLDPDRRMALYSPAAKHVWGGKLEILEVRVPETPAWGTNPATLVVRNPDDQPHEIEVHSQCNTAEPRRGFGYATKQTVPGGAQLTIEHTFTLPPFPGKATHRLRVTDLTAQLQLSRREWTTEFPFANPRANALKLPPELQQAFKFDKAQYARLRMAERGPFVLYYLDGDLYIEGRLEEMAASFQTLVERVNPDFGERIAVYLFTDADSMMAYTGRGGTLWSSGRILAGVFNEKEGFDPSRVLERLAAR